MTTGRIKRDILASAVTLFTLVAGNWAASGAAPQQEDKPTEQVNKNIQVLEGMPNSQLLPVMHFMRTSLGVRCDYCHIAENGKYWMDDKPAKQTARRMIKMVSEINKTSFAGQPVVTCNTCHRGQIKPVAVPAINQGVFPNTTRDDSAKAPDPLPTADQLIDRHFQSIGGLASFQKINTRIVKVSSLRPKLVNGGTPKAAMIARGETWTIEIYQKAPNKYLAITNTPDDTISQGFNGTTGWVKNSQGQREMSAGELARIKRQADLLGDFALRDRYSAMTVVGIEKIDDREAYVVEAQSRDRRTEKLFFDVQSGLLVRRTVLTQTWLGLDPEQTDYKDYTELNGIKLPFKVIVSYLDDSHLGTTRQYLEVKQNVPIDDAKFDPPGKK